MPRRRSPWSVPVAEAPPPPESSRTAVTHGHAWTEQEDEELRDGVELGLTLDELAESMELPADAVSARLAGLGLEAGPGRRYLRLVRPIPASSVRRGTSDAHG